MATSTCADTTWFESTAATPIASFYVDAFTGIERVVTTPEPAKLVGLLLGWGLLLRRR
jgi:hypothetical protein